MPRRSTPPKLDAITRDPLGSWATMLELYCLRSALWRRPALHRRHGQSATLEHLITLCAERLTIYVYASDVLAQHKGHMASLVKHGELIPFAFTSTTTGYIPTVLLERLHEARAEWRVLLLSPEPLLSIYFQWLAARRLSPQRPRTESVFDTFRVDLASMLSLPTTNLAKDCPDWFFRHLDTAETFGFHDIEALLRSTTPYTDV